MIDTIGCIVSVVMLASALTLVSFFLLLADRVSKLRYDDRVDNDRLAQAYWMIVRVSAVIFFTSLVTIGIIFTICNVSK